MRLGRLGEGELAVDDRVQLALPGQLDQAVELAARYRGGAGADDPGPRADHTPEVERDDRAVDRSRRYEPAARGERGQAPTEHGATDGVEDNSSLELGDALVV